MSDDLNNLSLSGEFLEHVNVVIPALNEEGSISSVINGLIAEGIAPNRITVVDGGSIDRTASQVRLIRANLLIEEKRGYGAACLKALTELEPFLNDQSVILFIDADGSDDTTDVRKILSLIEEKQADFVLGSRLLLEESRKSVPIVSRLGNTFATWVINRVYPIKYSDLGPLRAIRWPALKKLRMSDEDWGWTVEMQIKAAKENISTKEIAVNYRERTAGESKISGSLVGGFKAGVKILSVLAKHLR